MLIFAHSSSSIRHCDIIHDANDTVTNIPVPRLMIILVSWLMIIKLILSWLIIILVPWFMIILVFWLVIILVLWWMIMLVSWLTITLVSWLMIILVSWLRVFSDIFSSVLEWSGHRCGVFPLLNKPRSIPCQLRHRLWSTHQDLAPSEFHPSPSISWNIARGTTDPGNWVHNLKKTFFSLNYFKSISVRNMIQVIDSIPWVRCASGNVFLIFLNFFNLSGGIPCISSYFGHQMALFELLVNVATRWHNLY